MRVLPLCRALRLLPLWFCDAVQSGQPWGLQRGRETNQSPKFTTMLHTKTLVRPEQATNMSQAMRRQLERDLHSRLRGLGAAVKAAEAELAAAIEAPLSASPAVKLYLKGVFYVEQSFCMLARS